jgi:hypothetical protein
MACQDIIIRVRTYPAEDGRVAQGARGTPSRGVGFQVVLVGEGADKVSLEEGLLDLLQERGEAVRREDAGEGVGEDV